MATLRRAKYLTCFYCGKRTSTRYDGRVRRFECPSCDATNYLDENGEITDPPVATSTPDSTPLQYAVPRTVSPKSSTSSQAIFCETCLKNQHLFTASLAQYFPEDVDHPDYAELEKNYYKFRRGLEQRYPQVCANCESKVLRRIQEAGYTAKTDHLRRMIDRSRQVRNVTTWSPLNLVDTAGRWLWTSGLALQLLWHASAVFYLYRSHSAADRLSSGTNVYVAVLGSLFDRLPVTGTLIYWSLVASISSLWWNPLFVQTVRGFTKHVTGLPKWYTYQAMLVLLKLAALRLSDLPRAEDSSFMTQIGAHGFMVAFMSFIYYTARRSVTTDTTPLFGMRPNETTPRAHIQTQVHDESRKSMSDILDDILDEPASNGIPGISSASVTPQALDYNLRVQPRSSYNPSTAAISGNPFRRIEQRANAGVNFDSLNLSDNAGPRPQTIHYDEQMDWSPTQSRHRAFNSVGAGQGQAHRFGQTPTEPKNGQFWYKVPPAPTNPAQRRFNPPNAPRIRIGPAVQTPPRFKARDEGHLENTTIHEETHKTVDFAEPSFFSEPPPADPRNTLSDLFGQSFSLSPSQKEGEAQQQAGTPRVPQARTSRAFLRISGITLLVVCLAAWYHAASEQHQYVAQVRYGILAVCVVILFSINSDTFRDVTAGKELSGASAVATLVGVLEICLAAMFALQLWGSGKDCEACNNQVGWLIGTMIVHQLWDAFL